jgi:hypothetical protein
MPGGRARGCGVAVVAEARQIAYDQTSMSGRLSCASLAERRPYSERGPGPISMLSGASHLARSEVDDNSL